MRFMKPVSRPGLLAYGSGLCLLAVVGVVPWTVVAAQAPAPETIEPKPNAKVDPKPVVAVESSPVKQVEVKAEKVQSGGERGKFVSYQDDTLTIRANDGTLIKNGLSDSSKAFVWHDEGGFKSAETAATLKQVKVGTWIHILVEKGTATIRIGARKAQTVGSFVSFKDNRLLILSKNLGESFVKKYGNQVHFNKFRDDVQAFESVDGGDYQLLGFANKVLSNVKEGTVITVSGEGDDNITLVQVGVPAKK